MLQKIQSLLLVASIAHAAVVEHWWNISYAEANPDGLFPRRVIGVNGTWPPPPLDVNRNDTLMIHAFNGLDVPTALHHHGMFLRNRTFMDGAVGVTQCPIPPGATFTYEIPTGEEWGTYWVHGHFSGQYVDGLRTPFVIHNTPEPHLYDEEYTIIMGDWYHQQHAPLVDRFMSIANPGGAEPVPESAIMYFAQNGKYLSGFNDDTGLTFQPGKTYRLRLIGTTALAMFWFWIDGHQMRVIEVDGTDVEEAPVDMISVSAAQRYSVLVTARNDTNNNWLIHANMDEGMFDGVPDTLKMNITSKVVYNPSAPMSPETIVDEYANTVKDPFFAPLYPRSVGQPDLTIPLNVFFDTMDDGTNHAMFENQTYNRPVVPSMLTALTMGNDASNQAVYGPMSSVLQYGQLVELFVFNWDAGNHPFHLHGHKFALVWKSEDVTSDDREINPVFQEGAPNPLWRDTVHIPSGGAVRIRFIADNPGAWFFHCHIEWHLSAGLAWTFIEAPLQMQQVIKPPQYVYDHCNAAKIPITGNAAGRNSTTDFKGLKVGPYPQKLGWRPKGIGAMFGCVMSAVMGMGTVVWYSLSSVVSD